MQLIVDNTLTGERVIHRLEGASLRLGRPHPEDTPETAPEIPLPSRFASRDQARLHAEPGGWVLEHRGSVATLVDDVALGPLDRRRVEPGDRLVVGELVLSLVYLAPEVEEEEGDPDAAALLEMERRIHTALLEEMDLRKGHDPADLQSPETRRVVRQHLDRLVDATLDQAQPSLLDRCVYEAVQRRLTRKITAAAPRDELEVTGRPTDVDAAYESSLEQLESCIAATLGLTFAPRSMADDVARLEGGFGGVFEEHRLEITPGLARHAAASFIKRELLDLIFGFGPLQDLIETECISEIMVVARDEIFIEKFGVVEDSRRAFFSDEMLLAVIERIVAPVGRRIDRSSPIVDAHLPDGSRVNAVIPPIAIKGPCLTIRKFAKQALDFEKLTEFGALSPTMADFLRACVEGHKNVVVSGGTGSGKTTLLNALSNFVQAKERLVTIEDTAELQLQQSHVVTLEARPPNLEGKGAITIRDLVKNALRMRPDRIVVGECRGAEALDMLQAMNTGHDGSMTTAHANSPRDMMLRLETMVLMATDMPTGAIRAQISAAVDVVIQLSRFGDGTRRVTHISEVVGVDSVSGEIVLNDIFAFRPAPHGSESGGRHLHTGYVPSFIDELIDQGRIDLHTFF